MSSEMGEYLQAIKDNIRKSFYCREGVATVIHESAKQLPEKPGMVVVSVGGGGLLSGVLQGMHDVGWTDVPLVAMETKGAHSFDAAIQAGELVTLDAITRWVSEIYNFGILACWLAFKKKLDLRRKNIVSLN